MRLFAVVARCQTGSLDLVAHWPKRVADVRDAGFHSARYALDIAIPVPLQVRPIAHAKPNARNVLAGLTSIAKKSAEHLIISISSSVKRGRMSGERSFFTMSGQSYQSAGMSHCGRAGEARHPHPGVVDRLREDADLICLQGQSEVFNNRRDFTWWRSTASMSS